MLSSLLTLAFLTLATAVPTPQTTTPQNTTSQNTTTSSCNVSNSTFYLVTTPSPFCMSNSSNIPFASATSLFEPNGQTNLTLRTIGPGYLSLPTFTFSTGTLYTYASNSFGQGNYTYSSDVVENGTEWQFAQGKTVSGGLGLVGGYLLSSGGLMDMWTLCPGALGQTVVSTGSFGWV